MIKKDVEKIKHENDEKIRFRLLRSSFQRLLFK